MISYIKGYFWLQSALLLALFIADHSFVCQANDQDIISNEQNLPSNDFGPSSAADQGNDSVQALIDEQEHRQPESQNEQFLALVDIVGDTCRRQLRDIQTIQHMIQFVDALRIVHDSGQRVNIKHLKRCLDEYDSLVQLTKIVAHKGDICHPNHVENILVFHHQYIRGNLARLFTFSKSKTMVKRFFRYYTYQVALVCRLNMQKNIEQALDELGGHAELDSLMPWRQYRDANVDEPEVLGNNEKQLFESDNVNNSGDEEYNNNIGTDSDGKEQQGNIKFAPDLRRLQNIIESFDTLDELTLVLPNTDVVDEKSVRLKAKAAIPETIVVEAMHDKCDRFAYYYEGITMSVVRLAQAGYEWDGSKLKETASLSGEQNEIRHKWLVMIVSCIALRQFKRPHIDKSRPYEAGHDYREFDNNVIDVNSLPLERDYVKRNTVSMWNKFHRQFVESLGKMLDKSILSLFGIKRINNNRQMRINSIDERLQLLYHYSGLLTGDQNLSSRKHPGRQIFGAIALLIVVVSLGVLIIYLTGAHPVTPVIK